MNEEESRSDPKAWQLTPEHGNWPQGMASESNSKGMAAESDPKRKAAVLCYEHVTLYLSVHAHSMPFVSMIKKDLSTKLYATAIVGPGLYTW